MRSIQVWSKLALCRAQLDFEFDKNLFKAKRLCRECPVASDCLRYAIVNKEFGIWGGTTKEERDAIINDDPQIFMSLYREAQKARLLEERYTITKYWEDLRKRASLGL